MVIAHNITAMNAQRQYKVVGLDKKKSTEKLSSGYRINRAADDAAGLSISEKMRKQIRGLDQGQENIQDGISYLQIGDGAMEEVSSMLLRMEELAVQGANGTNSESDRLAINDEVRQLKKEINRVSRTTKFNEMNVFDNSGIIQLDVQGVTNDMNFYNATYDNATGKVTYGGFIFHNRRISWDTVAPNMVYMDAEGVQRFHSGSYTYEDGEGNVFYVHSTEGTQTPDITRDFRIEADEYGIKIDAKRYAWNELRDEDGNPVRDGKFHEGNWSVEFEGAKVNFVLIEDVDTYKEMEDAINSMRTGKIHYQWSQVVKDSVVEKAIDISTSKLPVKITSTTGAMYANFSKASIRTRVDDEGIWLENEKNEYYIVKNDSPYQEILIPDPDVYYGSDKNKIQVRNKWEPVGGNKASSLMTWDEMGILDWKDGKFIQNDITYSYTDTDGTQDTLYSFTYQLSELTSLDSIKDGLDKMPVNYTEKTTYDNQGKQLNLPNNRILSMSCSCSGSPTCEQEALLGRDFDKKDVDVATQKATLNNNTAQIVFSHGSRKVIQFIGDVLPAVSQIQRDTLLYVSSLVSKMDELARRGFADPQDELRKSNPQIDSTGNCKILYQDSGNQMVETRYGYDYSDLFDQVQVKMEPQAGNTGNYVKLKTPYSGYKYIPTSTYNNSAVDVNGDSILYGPLEDTNTYDCRPIYGNSSQTRDEMLNAYAKNLVNDMVSGFQLTLHAADYTWAVPAGDERANQAVRTVFESVVQKSVGAMWGPKIQCSSDSGDQAYLKKFSLDVYALGMQSANTKTEEDATQMIDLVGKAQQYVSEKRSLYGAYQNRLEHTYAIRSQMEEDTTAAESRIRDTDMATEMVNLSKQNILASFGEAMMAQTRQNSQLVLSLLS